MNNINPFVLALNYAPGIGAKTFQKLIQHYGNAEAVFNAGQKKWQASHLNSTTQNYLRSPNWQLAEEEMLWATESQNNIITYDDSQYPELLTQIPDPPPVIYLKGCLNCLNDIQIAIVGSRNPTQGGEQTAYQFARYLGRSGFTIISGLALGIDTAAHKGALAAQATTIGVMGTGLDQIYPAKNSDLAEQIIETGALISEFPLGTSAKPHNFPRRNRIVSGLSLGVLVVEAAQRSGSLITARHALEQGREVFAIPGSIHNPLAKGCHQLIRDGAKLIETGQDIIVEISVLAQSMLDRDIKPETLIHQSEKENNENQNESITDLDNDYQQLLEAIAFDPVSADLLIQRTGFSPQSVSSMLLMLELKGYIVSNVGGTYVKSNLQY